MAIDAFLKIGAIKGGSMDKTYSGEKGWIDVLSWSWGASNSGSTHIGSGSGAGKANFQDIAVTINQDKSFPPMLLNVANGKHHDDAHLIFRKAGDKPLDFLVIKMDHVLITSLSMGSSAGEEHPILNITLNFAKFELQYFEQKRDGTAGDKPQVKWDIAANAPK